MLATVIVAGLLQVTVMPFITFNTIHPNLMLVLILAWGLIRDLNESIVWAFCGGVILDLLSATPFGVFTASLMAIAILSSVWQNKSFGNAFILPALLTLPYTLLFNGIILVYMAFTGYAIDWGATISQIVFPAGLINIGVMVVVLPFVLFLDRLTTTEDLTF